MRKSCLGDARKSMAALNALRGCCRALAMTGTLVWVAASFAQSAPEQPNPVIAQADAPRPAENNQTNNQTPPTRPLPRNLEEAIHQLGSTRWEQRETATTYLLQQNVTALQDVEDAVIRSTDPEVTSRLELVAAHLFLKAQTSLRGQSSLLGIHLSIEPVSDFQRLRMSVAVLDMQLGFPAFEVLQVGDRIIAVDGEELASDLTIDTFRRDIGPRAPGSQVRLTVLRGQEQKDVNVMLAGISEQGAYALSEFVRLRLGQVTTYIAQLTARETSRKFVVIPDEDGRVWQPPIKELR